MTSKSPRVEAFVLRFVFDGVDPSDDAAPVADPLTAGTDSLPRQEPGPWRGVVIRVQDNTEKPFVDFADAVAFIARDIRIGDFVFSQGTGNAIAE